MDMDSEIFLSLLVYKDIIEEDGCQPRMYRYRVLGPMMGTLDDEFFINTNDRKYRNIEVSSTNDDDSIRYAYYTLLSLKMAKLEYKTDNIEDIVSKYFSEHQKESYLVLQAKGSQPLIMRFDEEKMKRKFESDIAKPI